MNFHHELIRIKRIMTENCFPRSIIDRVIKSFLDHKFGKRPPKKADDKTPLIFCLPYLGHYSLQVKTRLIRLVKQCYPKLKLEVILLPLNVFLPCLGLRTRSHLSFVPLMFTVIGVLAAMPRTMGKQPVILLFAAENIWELIKQAKR